MRKNKFKILIISLLLMVFSGIITENIQLNRMIYDSCISVNGKNINRENLKEYNLDDMEKELDKLQDKQDNPEKYKDLETTAIMKVQGVPKNRILLSVKPFDLRIENINYRISINYKMFQGIRDKILNSIFLLTCLVDFML